MSAIPRELLAFAAGVACGYFASTLIESLFHHRVSDAPRRTLHFWLGYPRLFGIFIRANYSHHTIHHGRTFRADYVTQFGSEEEKNALDAELAARGSHGRLIVESQYAMTLHGSGALSFIAPFVPLAVLCFVYGGSAFGLGFFLLSCASPWLNTYIHRYLHMPQAKALGQASPLVRVFLKSSYYRRLVAYHYLHHKYVACNFNLLIGGDWIRDRLAGLSYARRKERHKLLRRASAGDLEKMRALGLAVRGGD
jgi:hypothetical protein